MRLPKFRPTPSGVLAYVALFVAMGGAAYAGAKIDTRDIAPRAVTGQKLASDSVSTAKFKDTAVAPSADRLKSATVNTSSFDVSSDNNQGATVGCTDGKQAITGGVQTVAKEAAITASRPDSGNGSGPAPGQEFSAWHGAITNFSNSGITATVWVVCTG